ncbi:nuclear transport factor 2 family protein [Nocardioides sp.]|jgi:steroid delta-isomerase|uniref:nuclear transport factor 2 family protein n=1 Tax=Nocardioides sp. TaxID=35761 RepID=UPI00262B9738|nr:nuclear transport factor 2 family protein [Nocardioides sp.]
MAASTDTIREVVEAYVRLVADGKATEVADLYADDATVEDPVGTEVRRGREAILEFYGGLEGLEASTTLHQVKIAAGEAVFSFELITKVGDKSYTVSPIDHMVFDEDGKITAMRAFWDPATDMSVS